ncbi:dUTP diphosphatase [Salibacterium halotolerans]|uniref:Dimeric dUTPase, all-alpha-NTP-PPase (MazG) superfamily n=1 Tax=Salibacterium halotolerans TaxID=1884432 RepID=A0A1I5SN92_9BACI|nr:dUTP diphosphatase [Salibacterium halotolerans]SFP71776.1 Dimeric dUTPase, all-alpha-NTP-PPase (MazG) superfamily [Salibacterium halotolerans]
MNQLFAIQRELDERILKEHNLNRGEIHAEKMLALLVEIGELANETRCFKYWSKKPASDRDVIAEEYVDGLHFILSLGLDGGWEEVPEAGGNPGAGVTEQFHRVYETALSLKETFSKEYFLDLFEAYITLGYKLGFSKEDMEAAYLQKNEANHQRQEEGY